MAILEAGPKFWCFVFSPFPSNRSSQRYFCRAISVASKGRWLDGSSGKIPSPDTIQHNRRIGNRQISQNIWAGSPQIHVMPVGKGTDMKTAVHGWSDRFWHILTGSSRVFTVERGGPKEIWTHTREFPMNVVILSWVTTEYVFLPYLKVEVFDSQACTGYLIPTQSRRRGSGQPS